MRFDRDLMIFKALVALSEYADACHDAPLPPSFGLRFALAYLYSQSRGESTAFTQFWNQVRGENDRKGATQLEYIRSTGARTFLNGIINSMKWDCPDVPHRLFERARTVGNADKVFREARQRRADIVAAHEAKQREIDRMKRESKDCGYL